MKPIEELWLESYHAALQSPCLTVGLNFMDVADNTLLAFLERFPDYPGTVRFREKFSELNKNRGKTQ